MYVGLENKGPTGTVTTLFALYSNVHLPLWGQGGAQFLLVHSVLALNTFTPTSEVVQATRSYHSQVMTVSSGRTKCVSVRMCPEHILVPLLHVATLVSCQFRGRN